MTHTSTLLRRALLAAAIASLAAPAMAQQAKPKAKRAKQTTAAKAPGATPKTKTAPAPNANGAGMAPNTMRNDKPMHSTASYGQPKENRNTFVVEADRFADISVLRYQIHGWESLSTQQRILAYYLTQAALCGRDIAWDQKYKHNLRIRKTIEAIWNTYSGPKSGAEWDKFSDWSKRVWFSNGLHHHYSSAKMMPGCSQAYFHQLLEKSKGLPLDPGQNLALFNRLMDPVLFDPAVDPKGVNLDKDADQVAASANNFYKNLTEKEVETYYAGQMKKDDAHPIMYGLNSQLVKDASGKIQNRPWTTTGMYAQALSKVVFWLNKAKEVAENDKQKEALTRLVRFYETGDLKDFDEYNIAWVADVDSRVDVVNGFIEVYGDAMGKRGTYESVVSIKDLEASKMIEKISHEAAFFEANSPILSQHKKQSVKGITAKVIQVVVEAGDAAPSTPVGINLPNSNWVREVYGSKSVSLGNIVEAYNLAKAKSPVMAEFAASPDVLGRVRMFGALASDLHTDMHEVIGHASGHLEPGVATPDQTLKSYANTLEEARADLVALYYILDPKLVEIGVMPTLEVGKAEYDSYLMNGLMLQLNRLNLGENLEEAHMRNRQLNASWVMERAKARNAATMEKRDGKTYIVITNYEALRSLFGDLLREIQRIKSQGDYAAAQALVEGYGVKVDPAIHAEVKKRFENLHQAPYSGFIQPKLTPVMNGNNITDVNVSYPTSFSEQMLEFGKTYGLLPVVN